ncbi:hypothetical protein [Mycobacterium uberis]
MAVLDLCLVTAGQLDALIYENKVQAGDCAAGALIASGAGVYV